VTREDLKAADGAQVSPVDRLGLEADDMVADNFRRVKDLERDFVRAGHVVGVQDGVECPFNIGGGDRGAVAPFGGGIEMEGEDSLVVGDGPALGEGGFVFQGGGAHGKKGLVECAKKFRGEGIVVQIAIETARVLTCEDAELTACWRVGVCHGVGHGFPVGFRE